MLRIETTAEIVTMSELERICKEAGLMPEINKSEYSLTDRLFGEVHYVEEYRKLNRLTHWDWEAELKWALENTPDDKENILTLRIDIAIQNALKEAGIEDYVLVEVGA